MPSPKRNTCTACRGAKVRCDRASPACDRCSKLGIACIEQVRSQGRPPKARLAEPVRLDASLAADEATAPLSLAEGGSRKRPFDDGSSGSSGSAGKGKDAKYPVVAVASILSHGFGAFRAGGHVEYEKATSLLRAWNLVSETHARDTSYGAFNQVVKSLGLDHQAAIFVQQRPPGCSGQRTPGRPLVAPATADTVARLPAALREMIVPSEEAQGSTTAEAVAYYVMEDGHVQLGLNTEFERRLMGAREACDFVDKQAMLPVFFWGCLFTAASQDKLYHHLSQALFCGAEPVGQVTLLLECVDRAGAPFYGVTQVRAAVEGEGAYAACALSIKPMPPTATAPAPQVVGLSLLPVSKPKPPARPAVKQVPRFPLLPAHAVKAEGLDGDNTSFTCKLEVGAGTVTPLSAGREWARGARARRPSARAREAAVGTNSCGEDAGADDDWSISSVSSASVDGGGRASNKRQRRMRVVTIDPGLTMVGFPYLQPRHFEAAPAAPSPAHSDSVQTGETTSEEELDAKEDEEDPYAVPSATIKKTAAAAEATPPPPPLLCNVSSTSSNTSLIGIIGGGPRRTVGDFQSTLLALASHNAPGAVVTSTGGKAAMAPPTGIPKPSIAQQAAHDAEEPFYSYQELMAMDFDWDLLAPSPLLRIDGLPMRGPPEAPQPSPPPPAQPVAQQAKPIPEPSWSIASAAAASSSAAMAAGGGAAHADMMGYGLF